MDNDGRGLVLVTEGGLRSGWDVYCCEDLWWIFVSDGLLERVSLNIDDNDRCGFDDFLLQLEVV